MLKNLKLLRTNAGISQQALAAQIGVSQQAVNKYENHNAEPDIKTLIAIANYFDTSIDYLVGRTDKDGVNHGSKYNEFLDDYKKLTEKEKKCVNAVIDTFIKQK